MLKRSFHDVIEINNKIAELEKLESEKKKRAVIVISSDSEENFEVKKVKKCIEPSKEGATSTGPSTTSRELRDKPSSKDKKKQSRPVKAPKKEAKAEAGAGGRQSKKGKNKRLIKK